MSKKESISSMFNVVTGASGRHNKALHEVDDWAATVQKFLNTYELFGSPSYTLLMDNVGSAKFDLTGIAYNGRPVIDTARKIKGSDVSAMVSEIIAGVETLRRFLIHPDKQEEKVNDSVNSLRASYEKLKETISQMNLM